MSLRRRYLMYVSQTYSFAILRPLQDAILARGGEVAWFFEGDEVDLGYRREDELRLQSIAEIQRWQPDAVFVPGNVVPNFIPGLKVGVFHGFPAGKINRRGRLNHFEIRGCFDLYCTQGPSSTDTFVELAAEHGFFEVSQTGWPMLDPMYRGADGTNPYLAPDDPRPTVLLCSTFSRKYSCAATLYDEVKRLRDQGEWRWLVQFHPKMDPEVVARYKALQNANMTFVETDNVLPLLASADAMLCDTSSILMMYLLQRRPVVTFRNQSPGPQLLDITEVSQVEGALRKALSCPAELMAAIDRYCDQLHPYTDGRSAERVLAATDDLLDRGLGHLKAKPLNLIRNFKLRRRLNHWWR